MKTLKNYVLIQYDNFYPNGGSEDIVLTTNDYAKIESYILPLLNDRWLNDKYIEIWDIKNELVSNCLELIDLKEKINNNETLLEIFFEADND